VEEVVILEEEVEVASGGRNYCSYLISHQTCNSEFLFRPMSPGPALWVGEPSNDPGGQSRPNDISTIKKLYC